MMPLDFKHNQSINTPVESELSLFGFVFGLRFPERLAPLQTVLAGFVFHKLTLSV